MIRDKDLAELAGIVLGDGSLYVNSKHKVRQFVITGHIKNDLKYFREFVLPLLERNFGRKFQLNFDIDSNAIRIKSQKSEVINKIVELGIPVGNKLENNVKIPEWIFSDKDLIKVCIRGLIDTDGSISPITGRNYPYIWFVSQIQGLQESFSRAMKILDFKTSSWSHRANHGSQIYLGAKSMVEKYFNEINFNNPYHKHRFMLLSSSSVKDTE